MTLNLHDIPSLKKVTVTSDIVLIPMQLEHADRLLEILTEEPSIRDRVTVASRLFTFQDVANEVQSYTSDHDLIRYVILQNGRVVGLVSLWRDTGFFGTPANLDDYGFGYFLDPKQRGKGIIGAAIKALMTQIRVAVLVRQFVAFCEDDNLASVAVLLKLGFTPTNETYSEPTHKWLEKKYILTNTEHL